jgi:acyl-[acyl carrier protein]--UDP-N-acetylglucosamine O-acyltransferase
MVYDDVIFMHRAYMSLIRGHGERAAAIELLDTDIKAFPEVARFVQFVQQSERGVVR